MKKQTEGAAAPKKKADAPVLNIVSYNGSLVTYHVYDPTITELEMLMYTGQGVNGTDDYVNLEPVPGNPPSHHFYHTIDRAPGTTHLEARVVRTGNVKGKSRDIYTDAKKDRDKNKNKKEK